MPSALIDVPEEAPEIDHLTVFAGLLVPETRALNCFVEPRLTVVEEGSTVTFVTNGFTGVGVGFGVGFTGVDAGFTDVGDGTVTPTVPYLEESAVDVALTVMTLGL